MEALCVAEHLVEHTLVCALGRAYCDVIAAARGRRIPMLFRDVITAARRRPRIPSPPRSMYLFVRRLADSYLAALCCTSALHSACWVHTIHLSARTHEVTWELLDAYLWYFVLENFTDLCSVISFFFSQKVLMNRAQFTCISAHISSVTWVFIGKKDALNRSCRGKWKTCFISLHVLFTYVLWFLPARKADSLTAICEPIV
jgi:hypothetical protein